MKNFTKTTGALKALQTWSAIFLLACMANFSQAQENKSIDLDGLFGHVNLGTLNPSGNFSTGLTIECWIKYDGFNSWSRIVDLANGAGYDNILFANELSSGKLRYEVYHQNTTMGISSPVALSAGRWYHVAATHDNNGVATIYIDGKAVVSGQVQLPRNMQRGTCFAGRSHWAGDGYLDARMDDLRIWNIARTAEEIKGNMWKTLPGNSTGLVSAFDFNEVLGGIVSNSSTNGGALATANLSSGITSVSSPTQSSPNALAFDGTNDAVNISIPLNAGSSYTKEAWIYLNSTSLNPKNIISSHNSPFWIDQNVLRAGNSGSMFEVADVTPLPALTWIHVAVSFNAVSNELKLYRDGILVGSTISLNSTVPEINYIGAWPNEFSVTTANFNGLIDEVRIWNVVRSQENIQAGMNTEINPATETGLMSYYNFNQGNPGGDNAGMFTLYDRAGTRNGTIIGLSYSGNVSNFVQQKSNLTILPVRFGAFTATKTRQNVLIEWNTTYEENTLRFAVEHSVNGMGWKTITEFGAAGNSTAVNYYQYTHTTPVKGLNYYRISQKDIVGKNNYSEIRTVAIEEQNRKFEIGSNIIRNQSLKVDVSSPVVLNLVSSTGNVIWKKETGAGSHQFQIQHLSKGIYYLTDGNTTERLIVQ